MAPLGRHDGRALGVQSVPSAALAGAHTQGPCPTPLHLSKTHTAGSTARSTSASSSSRLGAHWKVRTPWVPSSSEWLLGLEGLRCGARAQGRAVD